MPGPGSYEYYNKTLKSAPQYGMGSQQRGHLSKRDGSPDAGLYDPQTTLSKPAAPGYKIGTEARKEGFDKKKAVSQPGSGNYDMKSAAFKNKPRFHMGIKLQGQSKFNTPAPDSYQPQGEVGKKKAPSF